ncbi:MAG: ADP-forming succinate--CoA ligase subunit beta [Euryarchaeota archaeon]|nr:ADP-forming succinate--CoA ligase subunit beta [Euryarchaeota archaeon]MDE1837363.1 ADP-forming succinate--CoA ligase subunit beta [Euryarchaeota archaeon]MDE1881367.1 ADP-forming succinate--CoA ligase subunit beta [Euryarchaeota archaeon]MDE2045641.1 ADP-forming succinate--CoA ligase subunit beta [Thermoplasmata archaeon]
MVLLREYRGKEILRKYGVPVPSGKVVHSGAEAAAAFTDRSAPVPCVVKAQVLSGGRGKGGFVKVANTALEAVAAVDAMIGKEFKGEKVREVLLDPKAAIARELYLSVTVDRSSRKALLMASAQGGMEVEALPAEKLLKLPIHPLTGLVAYEKRAVAKEFGLPPDATRDLDRILDALWTIFEKEDAELVEINPLALVGDHLQALDAKVILEDDAMFRHPDFQKEHGELSPLEQKAHDKGIAFVEIGGDIGVLANGAGLTMATLDVLYQEGGKPGIFLDLGGTDDPKKVVEAFLMMTEAKPKVVFINIFGGVTRCDTVASGLVEALKQAKPDFPLVARIRGNNEKEGIQILRAAGIGSYADLAEAARNVVALEQGKAKAPPPPAIVAGGAR